MAQVSLKGIIKVYPGNVKAVKGISLDIKDKEFIVLVGPSGCGKSTTLRMIAGLEEVTSGDILISDRCVNNVPAKDRNIAMVFQNYALYPHMNVFENMSFGLRLRRYPREEIKERVNEAAQILNIAKYLGRYPRELSGGERQRVALGRAIVRKPDVFLFDEPLSNLDAKLRVQMRTEIHKLHIRLQTTMIYVTHDQIEAMTLGQKIAILQGGEIQQFGDPISIYDRPVNKFVAGFMGTPPMNFLNGSIRKNDGRLYFDEGQIKVKLVEEMNEKLKSYVGKEVIFGIRSEDIYDKLFVSEAPPENIVKATCEVVEPMGSEVHLYLRTPRNYFIAKVGAHDRPPLNEDMDLVFDMSKVHFFDKNTEAIII
ncbi:MAG: sn-glycerol-3-phosphate ABC transporter ATP-binding protein UgpC [Candidatus Omnitrophica bacterium]|nr:sn-glycerol-3-phosphate ABC transporter ATP-binding protein UgpC [Candidatus Omnitrophota bacterium]